MVVAAAVRPKDSVVALGEERAKEGSYHQHHSPLWCSPSPPMAPHHHPMVHHPSTAPMSLPHPPTVRLPYTEKKAPSLWSHMMQATMTEVTTKYHLTPRRTLPSRSPHSPAQDSAGTHRLHCLARIIYLSCPRPCEAPTGSLVSPSAAACIPSAAYLGLR